MAFARCCLILLFLVEVFIPFLTACRNDITPKIELYSIVMNEVRLYHAALSRDAHFLSSFSMADVKLLYAIMVHHGFKALQGRKKWHEKELKGDGSAALLNDKISPRTFCQAWSSILETYQSCISFQTCQVVEKELGVLPRLCRFIFLVDLVSYESYFKHREALLDELLNVDLTLELMKQFKSRIYRNTKNLLEIFDLIISKNYYVYRGLHAKLDLFFMSKQGYRFEISEIRGNETTHFSRKDIFLFIAFYLHSELFCYSHLEPVICLEFLLEKFSLFIPIMLFHSQLAIMIITKMATYFQVRNGPRFSLLNHLKDDHELCLLFVSVFLECVQIFCTFVHHQPVSDRQELCEFDHFPLDVLKAQVAMELANFDGDILSGVSFDTIFSGEMKNLLSLMPAKFIDNFCRFLVRESRTLSSFKEDIFSPFLTHYLMTFKTVEENGPKLFLGFDHSLTTGLHCMLINMCSDLASSSVPPKDLQAMLDAYSPFLNLIYKFDRYCSKFSMINLRAIFRLLPLKLKEPELLSCNGAGYSKEKFEILSSLYSTVWKMILQFILRRSNVENAMDKTKDQKIAAFFVQQWQYFPPSDVSGKFKDTDPKILIALFYFITQIFQLYNCGVENITRPLSESPLYDELFQCLL